MICLDEDYLGFDANAIIVRGLKVCGGLVCRLSNTNLIGAHFTNITTDQEILTGCSYLANHYAVASPITAMYFVFNQYAWSVRKDKYKDQNILISELKLMFRYSGPAHTFDKNKIAHSVDIRIEANPATFAYRVTLPDDPLVTTPNNDVKVIRSSGKGATETTPVVKDTGGVFVHRLSQSLAGFTDFGKAHGLSVV